MRRRLRGRTTWLALAVAVILAAGAVGAWALARPDSSQATTPILATATVGTIRETVSTTGTVAPAREADLSFAVSGTVTSVPVSVGDRVARGATLATIDSADLRTAVELAQASVDAAQEQVDSSTSATAAQRGSAAAQLAAAQGSLRQASKDLADATLVSPITGTVAAVSIADGDSVGSGGSGSGGSGSSGGNGSAAASGSSGSSSAQIVVISTNAWVINASVGAADLAQVTRGLQVEITPDGSSQRLFGTVSSVGVMASASNGGPAAFPVTIKVTGSPRGLYAGGTVSAAIVVRQLDNVLTVPTAAVSSDSRGTYVTVSRSGRQTRTDVGVGTVFGGSTQITSGLSEGDQVVVRTLRLPQGGTGGTNVRQRGQLGGQFGGGQFGGGGQGSGGGAAPGAGTGAP